ncbi:class II fructose-bisphosphatase [Candidatus Acetothermia bacterium]|nr:class II fructose-bisphosphatase [Candidatus Acetothermia bacterium]MBI3642850.1 class II fructose-bisphosphatase [Candidatus Acetothermia bacterium]
MKKERLPHHFEFDLVRVTEAAALTASPFVGRDDKKGADQAAVDAMRRVLNSMEMSGVVVIGEGEKDEAPMLFNGEKLGTGSLPEVDLAVDPVDGTTPCAKGRENSIATIAMAPRGTMYDPGPFVYMNKIAVGPECVGVIDIEKSAADNLKAISKALDKELKELVVVVLDRPRHEELVSQIRKVGARVRLILDGDVMGAFLTAWPGSGVDVLMGVGGSPEGVLAACALRGLGGEFQGKPYPRNEDEKRRGHELGYDFNAVLTHHDLVSSNDVIFSATGITDGAILQGVEQAGDAASTHSIVVHGASSKVREVITTHLAE